MSAVFQRAGMFAERIDRLKISARNANPRGPRCFRWRIVRWSGPAAVELPLAATAEATWEAEKVGRPAAWMSSFLNLRLRTRVEGSEVWGTMDVNCRFSRLAIAAGLV